MTANLAAEEMDAWECSVVCAFDFWPCGTSWHKHTPTRGEWSGIRNQIGRPCLGVTIGDMSTDPHSPSWREKLHPMFLELAPVYQKTDRALLVLESEFDQRVNRLGPSATANDRQLLAAYFNARATAIVDEGQDALLEINARFPNVEYDERAYSYVEGLEDVDPLFRYMHWQRHHESLLQNADADARRDLSATRRMARTHEDFRRAVWKLGGIKPFKGDEPHRALLELILCFTVMPLTAEERAEIVDAYCACGKRTHDADALKKMDARLRTDLEASLRAAKNRDKMG